MTWTLTLQHAGTGMIVSDFLFDTEEEALKVFNIINNFVTERIPLEKDMPANNIVEFEHLKGISIVKPACFCVVNLIEFSKGVRINERMTEERKAAESGSPVGFGGG